MRTNSLPLHATAKPDWKQWISYLRGEVWKDYPTDSDYHSLVNSRVVLKGNKTAGASLCACCGGMWVEAGGKSLKNGNDLTQVAKGGTYQNNVGIYFGEFQDATTLVHNIKLEDAVTFEFKDGGITHSFAWKDQ